MCDYSERISEYINSQRDNILKDIAALVAIPSVKGEADEKYPFGRYPALALEKALELCERSGFAVKNISNAIGFADMNDLPTELGIFAHADVVAASGSWDSDPFKLTCRDGIMYGRGVSDDKGPAVAALYAMKAVKELGIPLKRNVRLIIGSDEECGSSDLEYYFAHEETPPYSFSPDAEFPLINTEKGRFAPVLAADVGNEEAIYPRMTYFSGGCAANAVPDKAVAHFVGIDELAFCNACENTLRLCGVKLETEFENGCLKATVTGSSAHASLPESGNNAITAMLAIINDVALADCKSTFLMHELARLFAHNDVYGAALGVAQEDGISGKLTCSLDILSFDGGRLTACFDARMPICSTRDNTADKLCGLFEELGFTVEELNLSEPHHVEPELPFIKTLLAAYEKYTGRKGECMAIGGGTYVHNIKNGVAFGSVMPGVETNMHGANESMPLEDILTSAKIYAEVITAICG